MARKYTRLLSEKNAWTADRVDKFTEEVLKTGTLRDVNAVHEIIYAAAPYTYTFTIPGTDEWGGVVLFCPMVEGDQALIHSYLWHPVMFGRRAVARALLKDAFRRWDLRRITAQNPKRNRLAQRHVRELGFTQEGVIREGICYTDNSPDDLVVWGLLRSEVLTDGT